MKSLNFWLGLALPVAGWLLYREVRTIAKHVSPPSVVEDFALFNVMTDPGKPLAPAQPDVKPFGSA